jgi:hypothetical protein
MTRHQSIQLARWWIAIVDIEARIDNEIIPVGTHLGIEDPDLMEALKTLSEKTKIHLDKFKLQALSKET